MVPEKEDNYSNRETDRDWRQSEIVCEPDTLGEDFAPDVLRFREKETNALRRIFDPRRRLNQHAVIIGARGVGKTTFWRRFARELTGKASDIRRPITVVDVKCTETSTPTEVCERMIVSLGGTLPHERSPEERCLMQLKKMLEGKRTIILLDEAHYLLRDKRSRSMLTRLWMTSSQFQGSTEMALVLVMHPEGMYILRKGGHPLMANHTIVRFQSYDIAQLEEITRQRIGLALAPGSIDDDCIEMIADAGLRFAQARTVVQTLRDSAGIAESEGKKTIMPDHIRTALGDYYDAFCESDMNELSMHERFAIFAASLMLKKKVWIECKELYEKYVEVCEDNLEDPRCERAFRETLHRTETEGYVILRNVREGRSSRLIVGMDVPTARLRERMEHAVNSI